ncbi:MAG: hypothetical protein KDE51_13795, partial [Anaerolineales bacterium]|nr:hypothetical protein [Anaerolineales bacterium]
GHLPEDEIETYFGFTDVQQMIDEYGEAITELLWGTSFTWGDVMAYTCGECDNGVGYAMLLLLESHAGSETFRGAFWGIDAIHNGHDYRGIEVSNLLGNPSFAEKSISKTEDYQNSWDSIPVNRSAYGMGQDGNNMLAGTWYDAAFWRPAVFVGTFFVPGAKPASAAAKWIPRVLDGWGIVEEVTDDITGIGHPVGEYLTVYPTIRIVNTLNPHSNNTYTFLAPNGP